MSIKNNDSGLLDSLDFSDEIEINVNPNPVKNDLNIQLISKMELGFGLLEIYDSKNKRRLFMDEVRIKEGATLFQRPIYLDKGIYILKVSGNRFKKTEKIVVL